VPSRSEAAATFAANRALGSVTLSVKSVAGKTRRDAVHEAGSLRVRCPGAPAGELEAVLINTAGGVAGGDRFSLDVAAGEGTRLTVTTAAAEKVYRSLGEDSTVNVKLDIAAGATLAWLPQETILFDRARLARSIEVDLASDAQLFLAEAMVDAVRALQQRFGGEVGVSVWNGLASVRLCAADGAALRHDLTHVMTALRGALPRLWMN